VVARIVEVQPRRWKVDANGRQDAVLMLASVNLPGGVQVRSCQLLTTYPSQQSLIADHVHTRLGHGHDMVRYTRREGNLKAMNSKCALSSKRVIFLYVKFKRSSRMEPCLCIRGLFDTEK
jgi:hypothetical protein